MLYLQATTNPVTVEIGVEYWRPQDPAHWIPEGFQTVSLTVDADDLEDDYYVTLNEAAETWCSTHGFTFCQLLEEP